METGRRIFAEKMQEDNAWESSTQDLRVRYESSEANAYAEALIAQGLRKLIDNLQQSETAHDERFAKTEQSQDESLSKAERRPNAMRDTHLEYQTHARAEIAQLRPYAEEWDEHQRAWLESRESLAYERVRAEINANDLAEVNEELENERRSRKEEGRLF